jgi:hypothetical protein
MFAQNPSHKCEGSQCFSIVSNGSSEKKKQVHLFFAFMTPNDILSEHQRSCLPKNLRVLRVSSDPEARVCGRGAGGEDLVVHRR